MGEVKGYPRALLDQACCIGLIGKNVIIDCETRAEAEELLDWLCDGRAAETTAQAEIEALRWENAELVGALETIQRWRDDCKSYDEECGHPDRLFCEDVGLIEAYAERILGRVQARAALSEPQP